MPTYNILDESGNVVNSIVADLGYVQQIYPNRYHEVIPRTPTLPKIITKLSFRFRLTDVEYTAILAASKTDISVQAWVETFNMVTQVNLDDPRTKTGLDLLVSKNIITQSRADSILNAQVLENERP